MAGLILVMTKFLIVKGEIVMKGYPKKLFLMVMVLSTLLLAVACGPKLDETVLQGEIAEAIDSFRNAVQDYNIGGMTDFLANDDFLLTIVEGNNSYDKDLATLLTELEEDEAKQLNWRQSPPEGQGYILKMELGTLTYNNLSAGGCYTIVPFIISEKADNIPETITDRGSMVCEMIKLEGVWLCEAMIINFEDPNQALAAYLSDLQKEKICRGKGFVFGRFTID